MIYSYDSFLSSFESLFNWRSSYCYAFIRMCLLLSLWLFLLLFFIFWKHFPCYIFKIWCNNSFSIALYKVCFLWLEFIIYPLIKSKKNSKGAKLRQLEGNLRFFIPYQASILWMKVVKWIDALFIISTILFHNFF